MYIIPIPPYGTCPNCGHCPHCGRSNPPYVQPHFVPFVPFVPQPTITWGNTTGNAIGGSVGTNFH